MVKSISEKLLGFCGCEKHENFELFADIEKAVVDLRWNENQAARLDDVLFHSDAHPGTPAYNVVHLIFIVRLLRISRTRGQHVNADAQCGYAQEFLV
jgi:hypothetical protein